MNKTHHSGASRLIAGLLALQMTGVPGLVAGEASEKKPAQAAPARPTPNRTLPRAVPPPLVPTFSKPPLDTEIYRARIFDEPFVPAAGAREAREDSALSAAILEHIRGGSPSDLERFEAFLRAHPQSRWTGALLLDMGIVYRRTGYFTRALESWEKAWTLLKGESEPRARALADRAVGELAELSARLGRYERLEALFAELGTRDVRGPAGQKIAGAREGLAVMQKEPEHAFLCGPFGLDRILARVRQGYVRDPKIAAAESTRRGTSMAQMLELAASVGLKMQVARRAPGAEIIKPALVHWKAGHFAALVDERDGRLLIQDPTFGDDLWITRDAMDDQASGYALVPQGTLPAGWEPLPPSAGESVWGKGVTTGSTPQAQGPNQPSQPPTTCPPMAVYKVNLMLVNLHVSDTPVGYQPPLGPSMSFAVAYNQREVFQPQLPMFSNLGPKWTFDWFSFAEDDPTNTAVHVNVYLRRGGQETYTNMGTGTSPPHFQSRAQLVRTSSTSYERRLADGSVEVFGQPDGSLVFPRRLYLTQVVDPQGNQADFTYSYESTSGGLRLASATDAIGQVTTFAYENVDPLKITKVTDPFDRFATFEYEESGRLSRITDVIGLISDFTYGANDFISSLTTPYGTTSFTTGQTGNDRWLETADPLGARERFEYRSSTAAIQATESIVPSGMAIFNSYLHARNTFYWDKRATAAVAAAMTESPYSKARIYHWLHTADNSTVTSGVLESEKQPLERRVWYNYPDQAVGPYVEGSSAAPTVIGRVLDDGTTQLYQYEYSTLGKVTRETDPLGRTTIGNYDTNGIDLLETRQVNGQTTDLLESRTYNAQHQPLTVTDAAGQTTTYTYNSAGQVLTVTTPPRAGISENRTTTYTYDTNGYLQSVTGPATGDTTSYTRDSYGRVRTRTDSDNYTLTFDYDALDRPTRTTYPDGSFEETTYNRLDPERYRDRLGHVTHSFHDALRRVVSTRDALGRTVTQQWCTCGSMDKLIDADGNATTWERDLQGRVTREVRADGTSTSVTYENTTSRLKQRTDAKNQTATYQYALDDNLTQVIYTNAQNPTPSVSFTYDPVYNRRATMVDGIGTTAYAYYSPGSLGAGRVSSIDGPLAPNDTISYSYDELGRVTSRQINGSSNTVTTAYDVLGRFATETNALGSFTYAYVGVTGRVSGLAYPNGQTTSYTYFDNAGDHRLQQIHHRLSGGATLSKFDYTYDAAGSIKSWSQQRGANPATVLGFGYDAANQLVMASRAPVGTAPNRFGYAYDPAGNRTAEQLDDVVTGGTYNNLNQLVSTQAGGSLIFRGSVNEPATVTVGGKPAQVAVDNTFQGTATVPSGTSNVVVAATDPSGNTRTNTYQLSQSGTPKALSYDLNGNLTSDGTRTYEWDAENRLLRTWTGASCSANPSTCSEFTYDGEGRRVRLLEKTNGSTISDKTYVWAGTEIAEERNASDNTVTKRYFGLGVEDGGGDHFYAKDHLGSIVDMTDSVGAVQASYDYDPYGRRTKVSGSGDAPMGYTGYFHHAASGMDLAVYRAYDANVGRWISPDPIGLGGGVNFYAYVDNAPIANVDPLGLLTGPCSPAESAKTGALCRERGMVLLTCVHHEINLFGVAWVSWASYTCESPFGNCTPIRHATLQLAVNTACKSGPSACTANQTCAQLKANMATNLACAAARNQINNQCHGGGNPGHQQAAANAARAAAKCATLIAQKGC